MAGSGGGVTEVGPERALGQQVVAHTVRRSLPPGVTGVRLEAEVDHARRELVARLSGYVLGEALPEVVVREPVREPASWVQHWKLHRRWWTSCLEGIPLARWACRHPAGARWLLRNPVGRWALRRPVVLWVSRRHPVRFRYRVVEVRVPRSRLWPDATLPHRAPECLGRPVVVSGSPEVAWTRGLPYS